jgi:hypothetical protein
MPNPIKKVIAQIIIYYSGKLHLHTKETMNKNFVLGQKEREKELLLLHIGLKIMTGLGSIEDVDNIWRGTYQNH